MPAKTVACRDCHKGTDRPSGVCYHCAAVRQNKERRKRVDEAIAAVVDENSELLHELAKDD